MIITGPNASGKTTLLKTTTINIIFSQQFGCGYYKSCTLNPYTHIHSYLNIPDTSGRDSLFQAESRRCKEIIDIIREHPDSAGCRHYCIFDELYSGTNPVEAAKSAFSFLSYLSKYENVDFILTTHYTSICKKLQKRSKRICNYKMDVDVLENGHFKYTYRLKKGISKIQGAKQILSEMNYPSEILDNFDK
jgi:DNA mismatch repair ATPase MutS